MITLCHDFEVYSELDVTQVGADASLSHPSAEILMLSWAIDDAPVRLWVPSEDGPAPAELREAVSDPAVLLRAFNAPYERKVWQHVAKVDLPVERFRCTMVEAYGLSFSGGMAEVGAQIGLSEDKQKLATGKKLIQRFCKPAPSNHKAYRYDRQSHPAEWEQFKGYCVQDTEAEREIWRYARQYTPMSDDEWALWFLDQEINDRGLPIDLDLVGAAIDLHARAKEELAAKLSFLTGLPNANSRVPLLNWLAGQGLPLDNLQAETIDAVLKSPHQELSPLVRQVLEGKRRIGMTAPTKWKAYQDRVSPDGVMRGGFQFSGASRTRRWSSRGQNLQNLKSPPEGLDMDLVASVMKQGSLPLVHALYGEPIDLLACSVRAGIYAPEGEKVVVADYSSIESRIVGWFTGCKFFNETFAAGLDTYKKMAIDLFNTEYETVSKKQRKFSKPVVLAGPYGQGGPGLVAYAEKFGVQLEEAEAKRHVAAFRRRCPEIPAFWKWLEGAINAAIVYGGRSTGYHLAVYMEGDFLFIDLPSGRRLGYFQPRMEMKRAPWGEIKPTFTYMGIDQKDKGPRVWCRLSAHMGGVTENITQAIARDALAVGLQRVNAKGLPIILHVHDEIGVRVSVTVAQETLDLMLHEMEQPIDWAPGLLMGGAGFITQHYTKD